MVAPVHIIQAHPMLPVAGWLRDLQPRVKGEPEAVETSPDVSTDLSPLAVFLSEEGLDFDGSSIEQVAASTHFSLEFAASSVERLTATGYYSAETETMNLSWHVTYQREVTTGDRTELRTYEADLQVQISQVNVKEMSTDVRKEDILSLVRRLLENLHQIVADDDVALGGVILEYADFHDLFALDNGKLAHDLMALINLTIMLARLRQMLGEDKEMVFLAPEREESTRVMMNKVNMQVESFQLEIRDVTAGLSTAAVEALPSSLRVDSEAAVEWVDEVDPRTTSE